MEETNNDATAPPVVVAETKSSAPNKKVRRVRKKYADDERPFACDHCGRKYAFELSRDQHIRLKHIKVQPRSRVPSNSILIRGWRALPFAQVVGKDRNLSTLAGLLENTPGNTISNLDRLATKRTIAHVYDDKELDVNETTHSFVRPACSQKMNEVSRPDRLAASQEQYWIADGKRFTSTNNLQRPQVDVAEELHTTRIQPGHQSGIFHGPNFLALCEQQQSIRREQHPYQMSDKPGISLGESTRCASRETTMLPCRGTAASATDVRTQGALFSGINANVNGDFDIIKFTSENCTSASLKQNSSGLTSTRGMGCIAEPHSKLTDGVTDHNSTIECTSSGTRSRANADEINAEHHFKHAYHPYEQPPHTLKHNGFHRDTQFPTPHRHTHQRGSRMENSTPVSNATDLEKLLIAVAQSCHANTDEGEGNRKTHNDLVAIPEHYGQSSKVNTSKNGQGVAFSVPQQCPLSNWSHGSSKCTTSRRSSLISTMNDSGRTNHTACSAHVPLSRTDYCTGIPLTQREPSASTKSTTNKDLELFLSILKDLEGDSNPVKVQSQPNIENTNRTGHDKVVMGHSNSGREVMSSIYMPTQTQGLQRQLHSNRERWHMPQHQHQSQHQSQSWLMPNSNSSSSSNSNSGFYGAHRRQACRYHTGSDGSDTFGGSVNSSNDTFRSRSDTGCSD